MSTVSFEAGHGEKQLSRLSYEHPGGGRGEGWWELLSLAYRCVDGRAERFAHGVRAHPRHMPAVTRRELAPGVRRLHFPVLINIHAGRDEPPRERFLKYWTRFAGTEGSARTVPGCLLSAVAARSVSLVQRRPGFICEHQRAATGRQYTSDKRCYVQLSCLASVWLSPVALPGRRSVSCRCTRWRKWLTGARAPALECGMP